MKTVNTKRALAWAAALLALAAYAGVMFWLHWQQLCAGDAFSSDLPFHLEEALHEDAYTALYLLMTPLYALGGQAGVAWLVTAFQLGALAAFAWGLRGAAPGLSLPVRLLISLAVNLAQAVWIPRGGYWYLGTVSGTVYHNTTYIALAPFAMLAMLCFYRVWRGMQGKLDPRAWLVCTFFLALSAAFKANFVFAFAPALLLLLIADLLRTRGKNLRNEVIMGCSVLPSIALCLLESLVVFSGEDEGLQLIFSVDPVNFENGVLSWGFFNDPTRRGLIRSLVFVGAVALLLGRLAWGSFRYRFSALTFAVAMAQSLLLVESGERLGHANLWWGAFICYWLFLLESVCALLRGWQAWRQNHAALLGGRLAVCTAALGWHIVSGVCFLVLLLQGNSYNIPIASWKFWF